MRELMAATSVEFVTLLILPMLRKRRRCSVVVEPDVWTARLGGVAATAAAAGVHGSQTAGTAAAAVGSGQILEQRKRASLL